MPTDVFNYENSVRNSGEIASADFAAIFTGEKQALVQSVSVEYGQQIEAVTQVGDTQVYWIPGRPQGSLNVTKLVGAGGFFKGWQGKACGRIENLRVSVNGGRCGFSGAGNLTFDGGVVKSFSANLGSQAMTISESVTIQIASLSAGS